MKFIVRILFFNYLLFKNIFLHHYAPRMGHDRAIIHKEVPPYTKYPDFGHEVNFLSFQGPCNL